MSNEQVAAWLAALPEITESEALTEIDNNDDGNGVVEVYEATQDQPRYVQIQVLYDDSDVTTIKYVVFAPEAFTFNETEFPAGWSLLEVVAESEEQITMTVTPITARAEFDFGETVTVTSVSTKLSAINGEAIGVIEGEPVQTFGIEKVGTNCTISGSATIDADETVTLTVTPAAGYALPDNITVSKAEYVYDKDAGTIVLSEPTDAVYVGVVCVLAHNLTPFAVGSSFPRIAVDPEAISAADLATWLDAQSAGNVMEYTVPGVVTPTPWTIGTIDSQKALIIPLYQGTVAKSTTAQIVCVEDDASYAYDDGNGATTLSLTKGWNVITSGDGLADSATVAAITESSVHALQNGIRATVTVLSEGFATINGEAVGSAPNP